MATIKELYTQSLLAQASYATLNAGQPSVTDLMAGSTMAQAQAIEFSENWTVIDQYTDASGASATIFQENSSGRTFLAVRGTTPSDIGDLTADYILATGFPYFVNPQYIQLRAVVQNWIDNGKLGASFSITGHSLGGYLATALGTHFSSHTSEVYTYNAPGVGGTVGNIIDKFNAAFGFNNLTLISNLTNIRGSAGFSAISGLGLQLSPPQMIETELDSINPFGNHSIVNLTNSLALMSLFATLDANLSVSKLNEYIKKSGIQEQAEQENVLDALRKLLGQSNPTTVGESSSFWTNLVNLQASSLVQSLTGKITISQSPVDLADVRGDFGSFLSVYYLSPFTIKANDSAADNALKNANLQLKYQWEADISLNPEQLLNGEATYSDAWIADRLAMLGWVNKRNNEDANVNKIFDGSDSLYWDEATQTEIQIGSFFVGALDRRQFRFGDGNSNFIEGGNKNDRLYGMADNDTIVGGSGDDALDGGAGQDTLNGGTGRDILYGGADVDVLIGGSGNDLLLGGSGVDVYQFSGDHGIDIVNDSDGDGVILVNNSALNNASQKLDGIYTNTALGYSITQVDGGSSLVISKAGDANRIIIKNWSTDKNLSVDLNNNSPIIPTGNLINGDIHKSVDDKGTVDPYDDIYYYSGSNYINDGSEIDARDMLNGTAADDVMYGFGGDDFLSGGQGNDYLYGGEGDDLIQGGAGTDYIFGGAGRDVIFAGAGVQLLPKQNYTLLTPASPYDQNFTVVGNGFSWLTSYQSAYLASNGALKGVTITLRGGDAFLGSSDVNSDGSTNFIDAGADDDFVTGSAGAEYVLGGTGKDTILGHAGGDTILGGADNDLLIGDSQSDRSEVGNDVLDGGGGNDIIVGSSGDDILYGGAGDDQLWGDFSDGVDNVKGNDFLFGGVGSDQLVGGDGDDYLDGGDDADSLYGGAGNDILIGGAGADKFYGGAGADTIYLNVKEGDQLGAFSDSADTVIYDVKKSEIQEVVAERDLIGNLTGMIGAILNGSQGAQPTIGSYISDADFYHHFSDGEQVLNSDFLGNTLNTQLNYTAVHLAMFGGKLNDTLIAVGDGNSILFGGQGNDFLQGNAGDNVLNGGVGDDIYVYNAGGGVDHIVDNSAEANGLVFGQGITSEQIKLRLGSLLIDLGNGDQIHIDNLDKSDVLNSSSIKTFTFADGVTLSLSDLVSRGFDIDGDAMDNSLEGTSVVDRINGLDGDDIITGGKGSDELLGGEGNDKYILREGDGADVIVDDAGVNQVVFSEGIDKESLTFEQYRAEDGYLYLGIGYGTQGDYVAIRNGVNNAISSFVFSDGASFTLKQLLGTNELPMTITGSESADNLFGGAGADVINALGGDDEVHGGDGNDTINGAEGDDLLYGEDGNDILIGESGKDILYGGDGNDLLDGGKGNDVLEGGAGVDSYVLDWATGKDLVIEEASLGALNILKLGDGISISDLAFKQKLNDLEVGILGTSDVLVIKDFYSQPQGWQLLDNSGASHDITDLISSTAINNASELEEYYTKLTTLSYKSFLADAGYKQDASGIFKKTDYEGANDSSTTITRTNLEFVIKNYLSDASESVYQSPSGQYSKELTNYKVKTVQQYFASGVSAVKPGSNTSAVFIRNTGNGDDAAVAHSSVFDGGYIRVTPTGYWVTNPYDTGGTPTGSVGSVTKYIYQSEYVVNAKRYLDAFSFGEGDNVFKFSGSTMTTIDLGAGDDVLSANYEYTGEEFDLSNIFDDFYSMNDLEGAGFYKGSQYVLNYLGLQQYTLEDQSAWFTLSSNGLAGFDNYFNNYLPSKYSDINGSFINGNDGNDTIFGSYNNDLIVGGDGNDYLDGGSGADHYYFFAGDNGIDRIHDSDAISELPRNFESFMNVYEAYFYGFKNRIINPDLKLRYEREALPDMPMLDAMDYAQLRELYDHGVIPTDTIHFGPDITLSGLTLSWANRALKIEWGVNKGVIIDLPVDTDLPEDLSLGGYDYSSGLGSGIEKFVFADGTEIGMGEMLALVSSPMPTVTPLSFELGMGAITNVGSWANTVIFDQDIYSSDLRFSFVDSLLIIEHKNGVDKMTLSSAFPDVSEFDPGSVDEGSLHKIFSLIFSNGLSIDVDELFLYEAFHTLNATINSNLEIDSNVYHIVNGSSGTDTIIIKDGSYDGLVVNAGSGNDLVESTSLSTTYMFGEAGNDTIISGSTNDYLGGGGGEDQLYGGGGNDYLDGGDGDDTLDGGSGDDTLEGGLGDDTYIVDSIADIIIEAPSGGIDTVHASISYVLGSDVENLMLSGTGALNATGNSLNNIIVGNEANNILNGGGGIDALVGGNGDDVYIIDTTSDTITETATGGIDTVQSDVTYTLGASSNLENLTLTGTALINGTGNALDNALIGNSASNTLNGGNGNDTLDGGAGVDTLIGGNGDDAYIIDTTTDTITEYSAGGTDTVKSSVTYTLGSYIENLTLTGTANLNGFGNTLNNIIVGNSGSNTLNGFGGIDTLIGGTGNDVYIVDTATDIIIEYANEGIDTVRSDVNYVLGANIENLILVGSSAIYATGNALSNALTGNAYDNILDGGDGNDYLAGGNGNDTYIVDTIYDSIVETATGGVDTVQSSVSYTLGASSNLENLTLAGTSAINGTGNSLSNFLLGNSANNTFTDTVGGNDILQGLVGVDTCSDTAGNNLIDGGVGADVITTGSGRDIIVGGKDNDIITTGTSYDVILFNKGDGADIVNASVGTDNTLSLGGNFAYSDLSLTKSSNDLILKMGTSDQITLKGWYDTSANNKSVLNLQVIAEAMQGFSLGGADTLRNNKVETFNFTNLVASFDAAGATANWQLTDARLTAHLSAGSDASAIGGDIAYQYGKAGSLTGVGLLAAQAVMNNASVGQSAQTLSASSSWAAETIKLS